MRCRGRRAYPSRERLGAGLVFWPASSGRPFQVPPFRPQPRLLASLETTAARMDGDSGLKTENRARFGGGLVRTPLPCLANLGATHHRELIEGLIEKLVAEAAANREENGSMVLGAARLQKQNPHTQPNRIKKSPAPRFHAFSVAVLKALRDTHSAFAAAFRAASERLQSGDREVLFPKGCFPPALPFFSA